MHVAQALPQDWLLARASGLLAYLLVSTAVVAGLALRTRLFGRAVSPAVVTTVHRTLSLLGLLAVGAHALLLLLDTKVDITPLALVLPGASGYRPLAVGVGVVAAEVWLLVHVSFRLRRRIGVANWRRLHFATFGLYGLATWHGLAAGTDSGLHWVHAMYLVSVGTVVGLTAWRAIEGGRRRSRPARPPRPPRAPGRDVAARGSGTMRIEANTR